MTNQHIPMFFDAGQILFQEAIKECRPYPFKVERGASCVPIYDVTITEANPGVVTLADHGLVAGQPIMFSASGSNSALPTNLDDVSIFYVSDPSSGSFKVSSVVGGSEIDTTGSAMSGQMHLHVLPAGMTDLFFGLATDGVRSGGGKNDPYLRTFNIAVDGEVITV